MKTCSICGEVKSLEAFAINRAKNDGRHYNCKSCDNAKAKLYYKEHAERRRQYARMYNAENRTTNAERDRAYYAKNRDKVIAQRMSYYSANKTVAMARVKRYQAKHPAMYRGYVLRWFAENPVKRRIYSMRRRTLKQKATPIWLTNIQHAQIEEFYEIAVALETQTGVEHHVDHMHPLNGKNFNGLHVPWNLQVLTAAQNMSKGARLSAVGATPTRG